MAAGRCIYWFYVNSLGRDMKETIPQRKVSAWFSFEHNLLPGTVNNCTPQSTMKLTQKAEVSKSLVPQEFLRKGLIVSDTFVSKPETLFSKE